MIKIKNFVIAVTFLMCMATAAADDVVTFELDRNDGIDPSIPAQKIEKNIAGLLTAINRAATNQSPTIDFSGIDITEDASYSLMLIWENVRMHTFDDDIIQKCMRLGSAPNLRGYEVQNIGVEMMPLNPSEYKEARNQEITITLDPQGRISDFVISMGLHQYASMMKGAKTLEDIDQRQQILHFVEQFRTAYCEKNKQFMEDIFSDDALIITGRVRQRANVEQGISTVVEYTKQTKREYLTRLFQKFDTPNSYINVKFDDIEVERNPINPDIYGVTVRQEWHSTGYSDVGTVFLLWDFTNKNKPKIYVRTWQPNEDTHRFKTTEFDL
ncbi:MAG: nuclear transport factor 2 family protein [Muribaculaceae bacterium]|nr:nuclear transport factor 2 family protein [Muribaculaceae bacterium]